ncbi:MAG: V-type ATP synthase subunit B [Thermotogae bacterium]|nr:V-type ATP synthase subunit B [Thermotogota bacterium]
MAVREYSTVSKIYGPIVVVEKVKEVSYNEVVEIIHDGEKRLGTVIMVDEECAVVQVFEGTEGLDIPETRVRFLGKPLEMRVSKDVIGRVFDGLGRPLDGLGEILSSDSRDVNGSAINPVSRIYPRNYIETGVSAIDGMLTLIRGQKLPIFSGDGLPHNRLSVQIARQVSSLKEDFIVVFSAIGLKKHDADILMKGFEEFGVLNRMVVFLNLADDPTVERISTPRMALTVAEYLAFDENMNVLVIMNDMTNYCEALREISNYRGEIPGRKGYPGYLYSDLASLYERAGMVKDSSGSLTQIPVLTMPGDDITHPIPDLTGYITEGQIVLSRELHRKGIYPPIDVLPSLSRLMKDGIGEGYTKEDHPEIANQLFASYSRVQDVRAIASIIGEDELSSVDRSYLKFGERFEREFISQGFDERRSIEETLNKAWDVLLTLPKSELTRIKRERLEDENAGKSEPDES